MVMVRGIVDMNEEIKNILDKQMIEIEELEHEK